MTTIFGGLAIAFLTGSFFFCGLFLIAAMKNGSRMSREEEERNPAYAEHSLSCALEGDLRSFVGNLNAGKIDA